MYKKLNIIKSNKKKEKKWNKISNKISVSKNNKYLHNITQIINNPVLISQFR